MEIISQYSQKAKFERKENVRDIPQKSNFAKPSTKQSGFVQIKVSKPPSQEESMSKISSCSGDITKSPDKIGCKVNESEVKVIDQKTLLKTKLLSRGTTYQGTPMLKSFKKSVTMRMSNK